MGDNKVVRKWRKLAKKGSIYKRKSTGNYYLVSSASNGEFILVNLSTGNAFKKAGPMENIFEGFTAKRGDFVRQHVGAKFEITVG